MARTRGLAAVFAPLALLCFACSLVVDTSDIDEGCPDGMKLCGGACVKIGEPAYSCDPHSCEPCLLANAIPQCEGSACTVKECLFGFGCPSKGGCEAFILVDPTNCGTCGTECVEDVEFCQNGRCVPK